MDSTIIKFKTIRHRILCLLLQGSEGTDTESDTREGSELFLGFKKFIL